MGSSHNIAFVGGGTGGHITPIVSLIKFLEDSNIHDKCNGIYRFGEVDSLEEKYATKLDTVTFVGVSAGKWRRYWSLRAIKENILDFAAVITGFFGAIRWLRRYQIDVVFCKGGYVALPVCLAARILDIDILVHESDSIAGMTNKIVAALATEKFGGYPRNLGISTSYVGQILSPELLAYKEGAPSLGLDDLDTTKTIVLVMGGSQGASAIFDALLALLGDNQIDDEIHFLVLLGTKNKSFMTAFAAYKQVTTFTYVNSKEIGYLYSVSDVAITRGGATSLAEQELFGIKKIIIPTPFTGSNHQLYNAQRYQEQSNDKILVQSPHLQQDLESALTDIVGFKKDFDEPEKKQIFHAHEQIVGTIELLLDEA